MNLTSRLRALERQPAGDCPACGGRTIKMVLDHDAPPEQPTPCPRCGRVPICFTIRVDRCHGAEEVDE